jgi:DNA-directed RNA polymerase specialized sigma24 family protein
MDDSLPTVPSRSDAGYGNFDGVAAANWPRLVATAFAIVGDWGIAEDVAQESLEAAWKRWLTLRDPSKRESWLLQICVRRALSWRRLQVRRRLLGPRSPDDPVALGDDPGDHDLAMGFACCSRRQRAVVVLHFFYGYTLDECAQILGCRPGTARSHLARALATMRRNMS